MQKFRTDESRRGIYDAWKESVFKHWDTLSSKYNVVDYATVTQYGEKHDKEGSQECFGELANKFDECMLNKKKYYINIMYFHYHQIIIKYEIIIKNQVHQKYFVFDTNDREIYSVEWDVSDRCDINRILFFVQYYTGDKILKEEKRMVIV